MDQPAFKSGDYVVPTQIPDYYKTKEPPVSVVDFERYYRKYTGRIGKVINSDSDTDRPWLVEFLGTTKSRWFNPEDLRHATDEEILIYKLTL